MGIRALLEQYGVRPWKGWGQHFLVQRSVAERIVEAADVGAEDVVLEIGPGLGALTEPLARRARRVVAVEIDPRLVALLRDRLADCDRVTLVEGDILQVDVEGMLRPWLGEREGVRAGYRVVANLPYVITSAAIRHVLEARYRPEVMVLMVQEEVAQRMVAGPGAMSVLGVAVQFYGQPEVLFRLSPGAFYPRPRVRSAVVRVRCYEKPPVEVPSEEAFFAVVRAGFSQRRKQLHNALCAGLGCGAERVMAALAHAGIDPRRRAETLSLEEWAALTRGMAAWGGRLGDADHDMEHGEGGEGQ